MQTTVMTMYYMGQQEIRYFFLCGQKSSLKLISYTILSRRAGGVNFGSSLHLYSYFGY